MRAVTHDGIFHADDVFAAATLQLAISGVRRSVARLSWRRYEAATLQLAISGVRIERTRDPAKIAAADIAFDVGEGPYDHHQRGGNGARPNGIPYASFGLIWRDFGALAVASLCPEEGYHAVAIADEVDRMLVQQVDAADNGVALHTGEPVFDGVRGVSVSTIISWCNPREGERADVAWDTAQDLAWIILRQAIFTAADRVDGQAMAEAIARGGPALVFERYVNDWQQAVCQTDALYVVYPSAGTWRVQGVPAVYGRPEVRRPLPAAWGALNGAELQAATGVADATFCHRGLFIAGAASQAGAEALAALALA